MKKYTVLSVLAMACLSMQAAELTGTRFAGYTTCTVPEGFSIVAVPFSGFDTGSFTNTNLSLEALVSTYGLVDGDRLIAFDEATENYYYYEFDGAAWIPLQSDEITPDSNNHVVDAPPLSDITKAQGYAFWLKAKSAKTVYLQGIANTSDPEVQVAANSFTLIGNALPKALNLNNADFKAANTWFKSLPEEGDGGDVISVVNATGGYTTYMYVGTNWYKNTASGPVVADDIPIGVGVWFKRDGDQRALILK